ncbi:MAG TPA: hypothetical protein VMA35_10255 [Candidatus Sulfopaludibacter sp.]|nr:hypothetical protein [Candidatus Sulfopaludibacter sp.]
MSSQGRQCQFDTGETTTAVPVCRLAVFLLSVWLTGCSTTVTYHANLPSGPAKPPGYPIPVYTENMTVPRPCVVIGTVAVGGGNFAMRGGSPEQETQTIIKTAWEKGADAVQVRQVEEPGFASGNYQMAADLLRYTDVWETIPITRQGFANYLNAHRQNLDPIEGVWNGTGTVPHRIGIMRDHSRPGRDFVGFILNTADPTWHEGYKKIDIRRGVQPGSYVMDYYLDDFSEKEISVILGQNVAFTLNMPISDEEADVITYTKRR